MSTVEIVGSRRGVDWGRVAMVPLMTLLLIGNVIGMAGAAERATDPVAVGASVLASAATGLFLAMIVVAYLRRSAARVTTPSWWARLASIAATFMPLVAAPVFGVSSRPGADLLAAALVIVGTAWSLWSLSALGTNLSIFAQTRALADTGPYRWVRHPLYVGEIVAMAGLVVRSEMGAAVGAWLLLIGLQAFRAMHEERLLEATLPGYLDYQSRTARLVPGVF